MTRLGKTSIIAGTANLLLFLLTGVMPYDQQQLHYFNLAEAQEAIEVEDEEEEEEEGACIDYDSTENTIVINCDGSFLDVVQAINDDPEILEDLGNGEYLLNANLEVADDVSF